MRFALRPIATALLLCALPCAAFARTRHASSHARTHYSSTKSRHVSVRGRHGSAAPVHHEAVAGMDADRATAIQSALIRQGYMSGEPTGRWDADSIAAMQKMQSDNGWQTKTTPDSRALIKLGLGPNQTSGPSAASTFATN